MFISKMTNLQEGSPPDLNIGVYKHSTDLSYLYDRCMITALFLLPTEYIGLE